ncbi:hypothetical protein [Trueperella pyogenes]|uniref:hypothetical protein n=1 Tax=Trueperella pyogenes TaxID=1661 RepID=UPI0021148AA7|nr:hypothetical protein [Trueperella pyogenes]
MRLQKKGRGFKPAEENKADRFHAVGKIHPETGLPIEPSRFGWTSIFAEEILKIARNDASIVGGDGGDVATGWALPTAGRVS